MKLSERLKPALASDALIQEIEKLEKSLSLAEAVCEAAREANKKMRIANRSITLIDTLEAWKAHQKESE